MQHTSAASSSKTPVCNSRALSHGTLEVKNLDKTGEFYQNFLGIGWYRQARFAGGFHSGSTKWYVACLGLPKIEVDQTRDYRWVLALGSREEVYAAREAALANKDMYEIQVIEAIEDRGDCAFFVIRDRNGCWWEFEYRDDFCYEKVFNAGDVPSRKSAGETEI